MDADPLDDHPPTDEEVARWAQGLAQLNHPWSPEVTNTDTQEARLVLERRARLAPKITLDDGTEISGSRIVNVLSKIVNDWWADNRISWDSQAERWAWTPTGEIWAATQHLHPTDVWHAAHQKATTPGI